MYDNEHADIKEVLEENRSAGASFRIIPVNKDPLAHVFMISEALDEGELVCFLGDRYVNEDKLLTSELMGHKADFPFGPFHLAARLKVPVFFYFAVREKDMTYRFSFVNAEKPVSRKGGEDMILGQFIKSLENEMKQHPEQWYNYYDFWKLKK